MKTPTPKAKNKPAKKQPDWENIAKVLAQKVYFAIENLHARGSGIIMNFKTEKCVHWRDSFADALELLPGLKSAREVMDAIGLPPKKRREFFKKREAAEKAKTPSK